MMSFFVVSIINIVIIFVRNKFLNNISAPLNCLQYFINTTGNIQSFNYGSSISSQFNSLGVHGSRQIANLNYNICIRQDPLMCAIIYSLPSTDAFAFTLTGDVTSVAYTVLGTSAVQSQACTTDYITIPGQMQQVGSVWTAMTSNLSCGLGFAPKLSMKQLIHS